MQEEYLVTWFWDTYCMLNYKSAKSNKRGHQGLKNNHLTTFTQRAKDCEPHMRMLPSISSTLNAQIVRKNIGFGSFFLVTCTLPKQRLYEKFVHLTLMKLTLGIHAAFLMFVHFLSKFLHVKNLQSNWSVITNSSGPTKFVRYNQGLL